MERCNVEIGLKISMFVFVMNVAFVLWLVKNSHIDKSDMGISMAIGGIPVIIFSILYAYVRDFAPQ